MNKKPITGNRIRRKSRKREMRGPSVNKYAHLVTKHPRAYVEENKTFRDLPVHGKPGEIIKAGLREIFHGRLYELMEDVTILDVSSIPEIPMHVTMGRFKLIVRIDL